MAAAPPPSNVEDLMRHLAASVALWVLASSGIVRAQEPTPPGTSSEPAPPAEPTKPPEKTQSAKKKSLSHKYQIGLAARAGTGYRVIAPYHDEFCGQFDDKGGKKSVCGSRQPVWLEISPSFGVTGSLEILVDARIYLENLDPNLTRSRGYFFAPGIKYFTDPESIFKFFATGQIVFENQDYGGTVSSFDVGLRSVIGINFDVVRYVGLYLQGGIILGFNRWLTFTCDFGGGFQVRY
jgi:hypothetical protein